MPSHLFDRAGNYRAGELSNRKSVWAGDAFARSGALKDIGNALPYAFNAGNLYHSLEYEHYELLQICAVSRAGSRLRRMIRATRQAMSFPDAKVLGSPWYQATTFTQWEMKNACSPNRVGRDRKFDVLYLYNPRGRQRFR